MKYVRDSMDEDDRQRLAQIVTETCVAVTLQEDYIMFIGDRNQIPWRTVWKTPRIVHVFCIAVSIYKRTYFFFCPLCSFSWRHFSKVSVAGNYGYAKQWTMAKSALELPKNACRQGIGAHFSVRIQGLDLVLGHRHRARILAWVLEKRVCSH